MPAAHQPRFLPLSDVGTILNVSNAQAYALVRSGALPAIKVGGRGQWRIETVELESYIQRSYTETREFIAGHPFGVDAHGEDLDEAIARDELVDEPAAADPTNQRGRGLRAS